MKDFLDSVKERSAFAGAALLTIAYFIGPPVWLSTGLTAAQAADMLGAYTWAILGLFGVNIAARAFTDSAAAGIDKAKAQASQAPSPVKIETATTTVGPNSGTPAVTTSTSTDGV